MPPSPPSAGWGGQDMAYSTWLGPCMGAICMPVRFKPTFVSFSISVPHVGGAAAAAQLGTRRPLIAGGDRIGGRAVRIQNGALLQRQFAFLCLRHEFGVVGAQRDFGFKYAADELALRLQLERTRQHGAQHFGWIAA